MFKDIKENVALMDKHMGSHSRMEILEMKITKIKQKSELDKPNSRLKMAGEKNSEPGYRTIEMTQSEEEYREKRSEKKWTEVQWPAGIQNGDERGRTEQKQISEDMQLKILQS